MPGFLRLDRIEGEANATGHEGDIEFDSLGYGIGAPGSGEGAVSFDQILLTKRVDRASMRLLEAASCGTVLPSARLDIATVWGDVLVVYLSIELEGARVSRVSATWKGGLPIEQIWLTFERITWTYQRATPDGGDRASFSHDLRGAASVQPN